MAGFLAVWYAHNRAKFEEVLVPIARAWVFIYVSIRKANGFQCRNMFHFASDWSILESLRARALPAKPSKVVYAVWHSPKTGWTKINFDGATLGIQAKLVVVAFSVRVESSSKVVFGNLFIWGTSLFLACFVLSFV